MLLGDEIEGKARPTGPTRVRRLVGIADDAREIVTWLRVITSVVIPDLSYLQNADADRGANPSQATGARKKGDKSASPMRGFISSRAPVMRLTSSIRQR